MKRFIFSLLVFALLAAFVIQCKAASWLDPTNDTYYLGFGDSFEIGAAGQRGNYMLVSGIIAYNPQYNISYWEFSRSGGQNADVTQQRLPQYASFVVNQMAQKTNVFMLLYASDNGSPGSNTMYTNWVQSFQFPLSMYNQTGSLTNDWPPGNASTNYIQWIGLGDLPIYTADGQSGGVTLLFESGARQAATERGYHFISRFQNLSNFVQTTSYGPYPANSNLYFDASSGAPFHPSNYIAAADALTTFTNAGMDSNTFTAILDFNAALIGSTNHCVVSGLSGSGNSVTFTFHADRMAPALLHPDGFTSNDMSGVLTFLPQLSSVFCEMLVLTNMPNGNYTVTMDGNYVWQSTASNGRMDINLWTGTNAFYTQAARIHYFLCDLMDVSYGDLSTDVTPGNQLVENYRSVAGTVWPTNTLGVGSYISNSFILANGQLSLIGTKNAQIHSAAQQTNHTFTIVLSKSANATTSTAGTVHWGQ